MSSSGVALLLQIISICLHLPVLNAQPEIGISFFLVLIGTLLLLISFIIAICFFISDKLAKRRRLPQSTEIW